MSRITPLLLVLAVLCSLVLALVPSQAEESASSARPTPTMESIRSLLLSGDLSGAEAAYLDWSTAWEEEDEEIFYAIETAILGKQFKGGDQGAFLALMQAGDPSALEQFRTGKVELSQENKAAAIRSLALHGGASDLEAVVPLLSVKDQDQSIVGAVVETIGEIGSADQLMDLNIAARTADNANKMLIGKTMIKIGLKQKFIDKYTAQLDYPFPLEVEKAHLLLAVAGISSDWQFISKVLDEKNGEFYPLALSVLGDIPEEAAESYVRQGLKGNESEKIAAMQSINVLPSDEAEEILRNMILKADANDPEALQINEQSTSNVRRAAIYKLAEMYTDTADELLCKIASASKLDSGVVSAAILAAQKNGLLSDVDFRGTLYVQLKHGDAAIARAARIALLAYAIYGR